jgi:hypothetical protein
MKLKNPARTANLIKTARSPFFQHASLQDWPNFPLTVFIFFNGGHWLS